MRVVLSVDMEGVSQLRDPHEIFACRAEYWQTGKARIEADTVAACEGLVAGGADEVIVLDNHGSGNPVNVSAGCLPGAARLETWHAFDLPEKGVDAMLQLGYHARGGGEGFTAAGAVPTAAAALQPPQMVSAFLPIDSAHDLLEELWRDHRIEIPVETLDSAPLIRLSVQAYTTEAECELLVSAVARHRNR